MKSFLNKFIQVTGVAGQLINQFGGLIPPKAVPYVSLGLGIAQGVAGALAHYSNPDGTPAQLPWTPSK